MLRLGPLRRPREARVAHPVLAVDVLGAHPLRDQRLGAAGVDRHLPAPAGHLDRVERVLDLLLEADVAAADRDRLELRARVAQCDQQREDVVAGRVGVDDQPCHAATASRCSSWARVGSPGIDAFVLDHVRAGRASPANGFEIGRRPRRAQPRRRRRRRRRRRSCRRRPRGNAGTRSVADPGALLAERDDERAFAALDRRRLRLVRREVVGDGRDRLGRGRRRVQDGPDPGGAPDIEGVERGLERDLELDEQDVGRLDLGANESTCAGVSMFSAPGTITIRLSPLASTRMAAVIVGRSVRSTAPASTPSSAQSPNALSPNASSPTAVRSATSAPSRPRRPPGSSPCRRGRRGRASRSRSRRAPGRARRRTSDPRRSSRRPRSASRRDLRPCPFETCPRDSPSDAAEEATMPVRSGQPQPCRPAGASPIPGDAVDD